jgi:L,D-transpeptidase ErfK/SrfK
MRLYPEDIAVFYDLIPIGTKVTVVNQPYLFGWRDGTLYLQAYEVMEDDSRGLFKDRKRLLASMVNPRLRQSIAAHDDEIDWDRVARLAHAPRALPVAITGDKDEAGRDGVDAVIGKSLLVDNVLPGGSNWDGKSGLLVDEKTFNDLVGARDPSARPASAPPDGQTQAAAVR